MIDPCPHIEYLLPIDVDPACIPVLRQYPELLPILKALPEQIHRPEHFPGARLTLTLMVWHDSCGETSVILNIYSDLEESGAIDRLHAVYETAVPGKYRLHPALMLDVAFL